MPGSSTGLRTLLLTLAATGLAVCSSASRAQSIWPPATPQPAMPLVITPSVSGNFATAQRDRNGHYIFDAEINGTKLPMTFDTGASLTTLRAEDARQVGIDPDALDYAVTVSTGHGHTTAAMMTIDTLTVGTIIRHNVRALVARPGDLDVNLLGQSFMGRIAGYHLVGEELVLQGDP